MILSRPDIRALIEEKKLVFTPHLDAYQDQPHAVDLRLGSTFYLPKTWKITEKGREIISVDVTENTEENLEKIHIRPGQYFDLAPGESVIASTLEKIELKSPEVMGVLYPRSSINRRGLSVDLTGIIDTFYSGHLMIPILNKTNSQIIRIFPGERICQVLFHKLTTPIDREDALRHGMQTSKYHDACDKSLDLKKDQMSEIDFIKSGNLEGLKKMKF